MSLSADPAPKEGRAPTPDGPRRRPLRWAVNTWLVVHLAAIVVAPASVAPASDLARSGWDLLHPYLQFLHLNHGYHFFAPEPGESALLEFEAERDDGSVVRGRIPDRGIWPRQLYHRYFMLTEHMRDAPDEVRALWHDSYARHVARQYDARLVRLTQVTHLLPTMERVRTGGRLDDAESYERETLGVFRWDGE